MTAEPSDPRGHARADQGVGALAGEGQGEPMPIQKVALASSIGATIEWYDFFIYGTAAGLVFNELFFPSVDPLAGTLAAYATFAVGFLARPIGGVIFGHYGDRVGRKAMLILTLLIMGVSTFLVGLLPSYDSIGVWAPILLVVLRIFQGIGLGGEYGGAVLMAIEHAPAGRRGWYGSWPQMGVPAGLLLGTLMFTVLSLLPNEQFLSWGWRIAFLASAVMVAIGLYIRVKILETPAFSKIRESHAEAKIPFVELMRTQPREVLLGMGIRFAEGVAFNIYGVFMISYMVKTLELPQTTALLAVSTAAVVSLFTIPFYGGLSDRIGRRKVYAFGATTFGLFAIPSFLLINTGQNLWIWLALIVAFGLFYPAMYGPIAAFWAELFETRVRYTGVSFVYQFSGIFSSGLTPLVATFLLGVGGGAPWLVGGYMMVVALISLASCYALAETYRRDIYPTGTPGAMGAQPGAAS